MKNRKLTAALLALLLCASSALTACMGKDSGTKDDSDTLSPDTSGVRAEQNLPTGDDIQPEAQDTTEAPAPDLPAVTDAPDTAEPPKANDDPSQEIPSVEMPDAPDDSDDPVVSDPYEGTGSILSAYAGQTHHGQFVSAQSKNLVLCIDWESVIGEDGTADVTVTVGISHYRLFSREKYNMGALQVDGNAVLFSTPAIEYDEETKTYTEFYTASFETDRQTMEIEASWQVLGNYGGTDIDTLTAGGTALLCTE